MSELLKQINHFNSAADAIIETITDPEELRIVKFFKKFGGHWQTLSIISQTGWWKEADPELIAAAVDVSELLVPVGFLESRQDLQDLFYVSQAEFEAFIESDPSDAMARATVEAKGARRIGAVKKYQGRVMSEILKLIPQNLEGREKLMSFLLKSGILLLDAPDPFGSDMQEGSK